MKGYKVVGLILIVVLFIGGVILFLSKASKEGGQDYFEGKILENTDDYIVVELSEQYEKLIEQVGEKIKINKGEIVKSSDFSRFMQNEEVRVLYSGVDASEREIEQIFVIYLLLELEER